MEDIGNLVYVIAAIAWLIYSGYKGMKKKAEMERKSETPYEPDYESVEPEYEPVDIPYETPRPEYKTPEPPKPQTAPFLPGEGHRREVLKAELGENFSQMVERQRTKSAAMASRQQIQEKGNYYRKKIIAGLDEPFSIKKAVIYDTIMKRKG